MLKAWNTKCAPVGSSTRPSAKPGSKINFVFKIPKDLAKDNIPENGSS